MNLSFLHHRHHDRQRGLTLIEVMIALTISLILLAGVGKIFTSSRQTYQMQDGMARLQENARFAMDFLARDIRRADYAGCMGSFLNGNVSNHLNFPAADAPRFGFTNGITGNDGGGAARDDITIFVADITATNNVQTMPGPGPIPPLWNPVSIPAGSNLKKGDIVMFGDCGGVDIFQITAFTVGAGVGGGDRIDHVTGAVAGVSPGNINRPPPSPPCAAPGTGHCLSRPYQLSDRNRPGMITVQNVRYFIKDDPTNNNIPTLYRETLGGADQPLVEGVENMQILYGEDTDMAFPAPAPPALNGDGVANRYVPANTVGLDMRRVVSVRIALLVSTPDRTNAVLDTNTYDLLGTIVTPVGDRRIRRVFTTTIELRNRG